MKHIVIVAHPNDDFSERGYCLAGVATQWREAGYRVTVLDDPTKRVEADAAVLHVDLTVVPEEYMRCIARYPVALNGRVRDISKKKISSHLVRRGDGYTGPVMVKTDLNCGGIAEGEIAAKRSLTSKFTRAIRRRLHWSMRSEIGMWDYPVFDSPKQVPWAVWHNPALIVEKFLPEMQDGLYCLRSWSFLGDAEDHLVMYAKQPIVKSPVAVKIEERPDEIPDEVRRLRTRLGFDFGKFDYGIVDGRVVLYDANRTPVQLAKPSNVPKFQRLAKGIEGFLGAPPRLRAAG